MVRLSEEEYQRILENRKVKLSGSLPPLEFQSGPKNKYNNTITFYKGVRYQSKKEAERARDLDLLLLAGEIEDLKRQVPFPLMVNGIKIGNYIADFVYYDKRKKEKIIEDVKGVVTPIFKLKSKILLANGIKITLT